MYRRPKFAYGRSWRWSRQTFSEKFNLIRCDFVQSFHKIFRLILMYHQTEFGSKWNRWEYMVMWWLYEPLLWSWPWREQSNHFVRHTGSWWGITILNLVTKGSEVQTISSGQRLNEILNLLCDLDLEQSNQILSQDTLTYNDAQRNTKLCLVAKKISSLEDIVETIAVWLICQLCDLDLEYATPIFFLWHCGLWWCITIPTRVTKGSAVQKILTGQNPGTRTQ